MKTMSQTSALNPSVLILAALAAVSSSSRCEAAPSPCFRT